MASRTPVVDPIVCVLFDFDGTLIDTTDLIFQSYQWALTSVLGSPASDDELFAGFGQPLYAAFGAILDYRGVRREPDEHAALLDRLVSVYRAFNAAEHDRLARPFPEALDVIVELRRRGYRLGLVTSKARDMAKRGLGLIGAGDAFDTFVFPEDSQRHKPNPEPLWVALERLGLRETPSQSMYVGDSTFDMRAGHAAGLKTAAALWGPFPRESLFALEPTYALANVTDLLRLLPGR